MKNSEYSAKSSLAGDIRSSHLRSKMAKKANYRANFNRTNLNKKRKQQLQSQMNTDIMMTDVRDKTHSQVRIKRHLTQIAR